jgi:hypothetical protein
MMTLSDIKSRVRRGESETLELKRTTSERREAARTLCVMLNHRGARLIFGVKPNGRVIGQIISDRTVEDVARKLAEIELRMFPSIEPVDDPLWTPGALREAPANAFCYRDYRIGGFIRSAFTPTGWRARPRAPYLRVSRSGCPRPHDPLQLLAQALAGLLQVVVGLESHPESLRGPEVTRQAQGRVGRHGALTVDDLVDAPRWNAKVARQTILADAHGYQKLFEQHLARVHVVEDRVHVVPQW